MVKFIKAFKFLWKIEVGWYSLERIWVITNIIRFSILSQNLEKDIQKYFVITRQLKLENIEPVACFSEYIHAYLSNRLLSIIQSHPPPWFIHPMEFLSINKTPTKMTRQWLCHLVEPKDGVLPPRSSTTTADNQRAYIHNTTQKARQFWWRKSPNSAQLFIRPFGWRKYYSNIYLLVLIYRLF